jgi:hypothetical protein
MTHLLVPLLSRYRAFAEPSRDVAMLYRTVVDPKTPSADIRFLDFGLDFGIGFRTLLEKVPMDALFTIGDVWSETVRDGLPAWDLRAYLEMEPRNGKKPPFPTSTRFSNFDMRKDIKISAKRQKSLLFEDLLEGVTGVTR